MCYVMVKLVLDTNTHRHTDTEMQVKTISAGQNWPQVIMSPPKDSQTNTALMQLLQTLFAHIFMQYCCRFYFHTSGWDNIKTMLTSNKTLCVLVYITWTCNICVQTTCHIIEIWWCYDIETFSTILNPLWGECTWPVDSPHKLWVGSTLWSIWKNWKKNQWGYWLVNSSRPSVAYMYQ